MSNIVISKEVEYSPEGDLDGAFEAVDVAVVAGALCSLSQ
jgi:hypothetical protein